MKHLAKSIFLMLVLAFVLIFAQNGRFAFLENKVDAIQNSNTITVTEGTNINAAVSPDHNKIVMDLQGVLWTLPADGGEAKRITSDYDDPALPVWSPDGGQIAFQSYK